MKNGIVFLVTLSVSCAFFYQLQFSTESIPGYDGYYHIKIASIIKTQGFISEFPWLWHTFWRDHYVDIHFLYHLLLIPFTQSDLVFGAKISTVFFFAALISVFYFSLKAARVPRLWAWVIILTIGSTPFLHRMTLPRAPLVALSFLILGWYFHAGNRYKSLAVLSILFVWLYGGFTLFIALIGFLVLSRWFLEGKFDTRILLAVASGIACGLITYPYFPENLNFIITQTFQAGLHRKVEGGGEWSPYEFRDLLWANKELVLVFCISLVTFLTSRQKPKQDTLGWCFFMIFCLFVTLNSRRFIEYLAPTVVISSALFFRDGWEGWRRKNKILETCKSSYLTALLLLILTIAGFHQFNATINNIRDSVEPDRYKACALWLKHNTPGSIIYLSDWDDFPELFFHNSKNKYLIGLDPAFLYEYSEIMYRKWNEINFGTIKQDPYPIFKQMFKTPFIFTDIHHGPLSKLLNNHPQISLKYKDAHCRIYGLD
ncbi:hypothetical protein UR09_02960 [Candidatus Nitromaritima sp. SCGC AAA799-A02]|nr:hypothetical protein UR09_02960 [Candidatus Nitromaritima sp. SCGC AAA799-A02]